MGQGPNPILFSPEGESAVWIPAFPGKQAHLPPLPSGEREGARPALAEWEG